MTEFTKQDQRTLDRALATNDADYIGRTLAIIYRSGSKRSQDAVNTHIDLFHDWRDFIWANGTLLHKTEA